MATRRHFTQEYEDQAVSLVLAVSVTPADHIDDDDGPAGDPGEFRDPDWLRGSPRQFPFGSIGDAAHQLSLVDRSVFRRLPVNGLPGHDRRLSPSRPDR